MQVLFNRFRSPRPALRLWVFVLQNQTVRPVAQCDFVHPFAALQPDRFSAGKPGQRIELRRSGPGNLDFIRLECGRAVGASAEGGADATMGACLLSVLSLFCCKVPRQTTMVSTATVVAESKGAAPTANPLQRVLAQVPPGWP